MVKEMVVKVINGQWYAVQDGKHLTAKQTAARVAAGVPYKIVAKKLEEVDNVS